MNKQYFHVKLLFPKFLGHSHTASALIYYEKDERLNRVRGNILGLTL